jgi:alpha-N-arabinofuranosidase
MQEVALDAYVDCETYTLKPEAEKAVWSNSVVDLGPFKLLDVAATSDTSGHELTLAVINRDMEKAHLTTIQLQDGVTITSATAYTVNGAHPGVINTFAQPDAVAVRESALNCAGEPFTYTFPAHSFTLLRLQLTC